MSRDLHVVLALLVLIFIAAVVITVLLYDMDEEVPILPETVVTATPMPYRVLAEITVLPEQDEPEEVMTYIGKYNVCGYNRSRHPSQGKSVDKARPHVHGQHERQSRFIRHG